MKPLVMVVEDDVDIRLAIQEILHDEGFKTVLCGNGAEALDRLKGEGAKPRVILLDMLMPVMNGMEFLDAIDGVRGTFQIPVLVLSASVRESDRRHPRATKYIRKPFSCELLIDAISEISSVPVVQLDGRRPPKPGA